MCVCVCVCVRAFMCTLGCELVVTTTLYYNCEKVIHNVAHNVPQSCHNDGSHCADYENIACIQRHNVELFAGCP